MQSLLLLIGTPSVAYLLLMLAILGLSVEILSPGLLFPSALGIVSGVLAFLALSTLSVNPLGLMLIMLSLVFFIAEAIRRSRGLLIAIGMASLLIGSFMLFKGGLPVNPIFMLGLALAIGAILIFISNRVAAAQRRRVTTGREGLLCKTATVRTPLNPEGTVMLEGEIWKATLDEGKAKPGEEVVITCVEGLKLYVAKKTKEGKA